MNALQTAPTQHLRCGGCGAALSVSSAERTTVCPYCASPTVVSRPATPDVPQPTFVLPFTIPEPDARSRVARWISSRSIFCRSGVRGARVSTVRGVYVPAYLFSATAHSSYRVEIGENYTETESYTTTENGKTVRKTRTVTKTEWRELVGEHASYVPDVLVSASQGLPNEELEAVEPFDLRQLRRFSPALLSGWIAEEASVDRERCLTVSRQEAYQAVRSQLAAFMPGDSHRNLQITTRLEEESSTLALVPVWVLAARYDEKEAPLRIVMNGQTGEVHGRAPLSPLKIALAVIVPLILFALALLFLKGLPQ